jgi:hypothetical protein
MRSSLAIAALVLGISISGWAQKNNTFKVKSTPEKAPRQSASLGKTGVGTTATATNAKNLQAIERSNTKVPASSRTGHKAAGKNATAGLKPAKDKNPPINAGGGSGKGTGLIGKGSNPLQGRLKQKGKKN